MAPPSRRPPAVALTHALLLRAVDDAFQLLGKRDAAALRDVRNLPFSRAYALKVHKEAEFSRPFGADFALLRLEYVGNLVERMVVIAPGPPESPAAGALLQLCVTMPANYPFEMPRMRVRGALGGPAPLRHGDVNEADGAPGPGILDETLFSAGMHVLKQVLDVLTALGEEPRCAPPEYHATLEDDAAAVARAAAHGVLPLHEALRHAPALLGADVVGAGRDWPTLAQAVELRVRDADNLARLRGLLRWGRLLCFLGAGRPASLAAPSASEVAIAAHFGEGPNAAAAPDATTLLADRGVRRVTNAVRDTEARKELRLLALAELDALAARLREPRLPGFDLALLDMIALAAGPAATEAALAAAVADANGCASLAEFIGLLG